MKVEVEVNSCGECPHYSERFFSDEKDTCMETITVITDSSKILPNCPFKNPKIP